MMHKSLNYKSLLAVVLLFLAFGMNAQPNLDEGKSLFKAKCNQCHAKDMKTRSTGPALASVEDRWADYPREDLHAWVQNSAKLIATGHARANEVYIEYDKSPMQAFPELTIDNIESILMYVNAVANGEIGGAAVASTTVETAKKDYSWIYIGVFAFLIFLALVLARITDSLAKLNAEKQGKSYQSKTLLETITSKGLVSFVIFCLVLFAGYTTVNNAVNLGRQQGYAPDQPIEFSHATHAGIHKIDCQYCHDGARRSKHATIPGANTCMNCHKAIKVGSEHGTQELTKIYASMGYDPNGNGAYIEDYENMPSEEKAAIYQKWITENYLVANGLTELDDEGEKIVNEEWDNIVASLTNDQKKSIAGGIEWIRVHNLPDHVYFNHSQHVAIGEIECQTCHGKVEEMDVLEQHAPLSMGWCINCHRETKVQFEGNAYYDSYKKLHKELASGARDEVTVEDIGGLECQKCHY